VEDSSRRAIDYDPASLLDLYFEQLMLDFGCQKEDLSGPFFKGCHGKEGKRFTKVNIGKNCIGYFGVEIATELCLPHPETFTGHCWRRSAGTNASNAGVNVTTLMSMMGWSCPKTAMEYVKHSRVTSLTMSMYLCNVQRQNCSVPFPSNASHRSRKTLFPAIRGGSKKDLRTDLFSCEDEEDEEPELLTQGLKSLVNAGPKDKLNTEISSKRNVVETLPSESSESIPVVPSHDFEQSVNVVNFESNSVVSRDHEVSLDILPSNVDRTLSNILQNLQNHGNLNIHFHFDKK